MIDGLEAGGSGNLLDGAPYPAFLRLGQDDVIDRPAIEADEVVVMALEPFGQLVSGYAIGSEVPGDHVGVIQHRQRAVQGGQGDSLADAGMEVCRRLGAIRPDQCRNDVAAPGCVPNLQASQPTFYLVVGDGDCHCFLGETILMIMRTVLIIALLIGLTATACSGGPDQSEEGLKVVVTTTILGDVVANLVGDDAVVEVLIPVGASPHDYQASSQQVASLNRADLVVASGLHLEEGLEDVLKAAQADGARIIEVGELVNPIPFGGDADHDGGLDPHFWMDPLRVAEASWLIAAELGQVDDSIDWSRRAAAYTQELESLDEEIIETLDIIPAGSRKLVANHDSMGYFAARYGFETIGVIIPGGSTLGDPSSEELANLVAVISEEQVPAIFAETTEASALAEAVAEEVGSDVEVVDLYTGSLGEPGSGADTYIGMLRSNAQGIADALS